MPQLPDRILVARSTVEKHIKIAFLTIEQLTRQTCYPTDKTVNALVSLDVAKEEILTSLRTDFVEVSASNEPENTRGSTRPPRDFL